MIALDPLRFWRFSLDTYARTEVAEACLALQDEHGMDVNILLFCCWLAYERSESLADADICRLLAATDAANGCVVAPLRATRRWLRSFPGEINAPAAIAWQVRELVKAAELEAERLIQHMMVGAANELTPETRSDRLSAASSSLATYAGIRCLTGIDDKLARFARLTLEAASKAA